MKTTYTALSASMLALAASQAIAAPVTIETLHLEGEAAAGTGGATFGSFSSAQINEAGQVLFRATIAGGTTTLADNNALFRTDSGGTTLIARENQEVGPGLRIQNFGNGDIAQDGQVFYDLTVTGTGVTSSNNEAIISSNGPGASILLFEGTAVNGVADVFVRPTQPIVTDMSVLINAPLIGSGVSSSNNGGILAIETGTPQLVLQENDASPIGGAAFGPISSMDAARNGDIAFSTNLRGPGIGNASDTTAFLIQPGGAVTLAREGQLIGGRVGDSTYRQFSSMQTNSNGQVLTTATIEDTTTNELTTALFMLTGGADDLLVLSGDAVTDGVGSFDQFTGNYAINNLGQVVFESILDGAGVDNSNDRGLFGIDTDGSIFTIIREGDLFDLGGGNLSTVMALTAIKGSLNDSGQFAFSARFANGLEGLFLADLFDNTAPVPLPGAALLFAPAGLVLLRRRRRAR